MSVAHHRPALFLSSTTSDLAAHRDAVLHVCQRLGIDVIAMEDFGPDPRTAAALCRAKLAEADLFLGLYAHRFGHRPEGFDGKSITQLEYEWGCERTPPPEILLFVIDDDYPWPGKLFERGGGGERLERFKAFIRGRHVVSKLTTPEQLKDDLFVHLPKFRDRAGPRSAPMAVVPRRPEPYVVHQYTLLQTRQVIGRERDLATLDAWVGNETNAFTGVCILCIVAIGGMGKSALAWKWFHEDAVRVMQPLAGRFWWSFYESDAGFERFVATALAYCSGETLENVVALSPMERENQLLAILDREPFLLVLDGLERILIAYATFDVAHIADDDLDEQTVNRVVDPTADAGDAFRGRNRMRKTIDPRVGNFLRKLTFVGASRVLVTTRLYPSELQTETGYALPGTHAWFLRGLAAEDALSLWREMGVSGSNGELAKLFDSIDNYPLLIRTLAGEVARYRRAPGDFDEWRKAHSDFNPFSLPLVQAKSHVLAHALRNFDSRVRDLLDMIAVFRSPVDYDTISALFVRQRRWSPQELDGGLSELEDRGLLGWDRSTNRYDLHPIVRGVVWSGLDNVSRKALYGRLEKHFSSVPRSRDRVNTLEDAVPMFELVNSLVGLERYENAADVYLDRIIGGAFDFPTAELQQKKIAILESLFPDSLFQLPRVSSFKVGAILRQLGRAYAYSGRLTEACQMFFRALPVPLWSGDARLGSGNINHELSNALFASGQLERSLRQSQVAAGADAAYLGSLAVCRAAVGDIGRAMKTLETEAGDSAREWPRARARIALWLGYYESVVNICRHIPPRQRRAEIDLLAAEAQSHLTPTEEISETIYALLKTARERGHFEAELQCLRILADLHRRIGEFEQARAYLDDLGEPAARGPYRLIQTDALNVLAEIERDCGNREAAIAAAEKAYERAWCDGPEYTYYWGLKKATELLAEHGASR